MAKFLTQLVLILMMTLHACSPSNEGIVCPDANCADYSTREQAQAAYDADRDCLGELDEDNDNIACEHLPSNGGGTNCPTTANCGCSGKNKDACASACCMWVVGTGCVCR